MSRKDLLAVLPTDYGKPDDILSSSLVDVRKKPQEINFPTADEQLHDCSKLEDQAGELLFW